MQLKDKQVQDFKALYKKHFNIELTDWEALDKWLNLLIHVKTILLPNLEVWKK